jgi:hypothetical protein
MRNSDHTQKIGGGGGGGAEMVQMHWEHNGEQYDGCVRNRRQSSVLGGTPVPNNLIGHVGLMKISVHQPSVKRVYSHVPQTDLSWNKEKLLRYLGVEQKTLSDQYAVKLNISKLLHFHLNRSAEE